MEGDDQQAGVAKSAMHIIKAFQTYCLERNYPPVSGTEETTLDAFVVWLVQNGLLSTIEITRDDPMNSSLSHRSRHNCAS
jgi:hypothetical protein